MRTKSSQDFVLKTRFEYRESNKHITAKTYYENQNIIPNKIDTSDINKIKYVLRTAHSRCWHLAVFYHTYAFQFAINAIPLLQNA